MKVRGLFVDSRLKEFTTGLPHEVTARLLVVQRVYRLNDSLPDESGNGASLAMARRRLAAGGPHYREARGHSAAGV